MKKTEHDIQENRICQKTGKKYIDIYINQYTDKHNESIADCLDILPDDYARADYRVYTACKKRH